MKVERACLVVLALCFMVTSANARFYWPWQYHRVVHHHVRRHRTARRHAVITPSTSPGVNCADINQQVKTLTAPNLLRALRGDTTAQRRAIQSCDKGPN